ncbi:MAG: alpha/beta hydrolase [Acidimicrobiales bacterium]|nr:alpha/beta hydrolase [Acidimicrobiales bacterium]
MHYDEFGLLHENAAEYDLPFDPDAPPRVERVHVTTPSGHTVSALVWGDGPPELVLLHGGAQNAHTWDTVAIALDRPLVAIDLPGHGHSQWRDDKDYRPDTLAVEVTAVIDEVAPEADTVVGMSLGGLTTAAAVARRADLADRVVIVDVTPGVNDEKASVVTNFVAGPETFASFDEILERTILFNPTRSEASLRRGVLHNARPLDDGTWTWRYDRFDPGRLAELDLRMAHLWDAFGAIEAPMLFLQGGDSPVVDDEDLAELRRRKPDVRITVVEGAGHSIQGDKPVELAELLDAFVADT